MEAQAASPYLKVVFEKVLNAETSDPRFEAACNSLVSALEGGASVFGTSASWDLGRDGVGYGAANGIYVLSSLRDDIDHKVLDDLQRITSTTQRIKRLYFCLSNRISEHARTKYEAQLLSEAGQDISITCLGSGQLAEIADRNPEIAERHYGAEIENVLRVMNDEPSESTELRGLRLALISTANDTSDSIRKEVYKTGLLDVLLDGVAKTVAKASKDLSDSLRLQRSISEEAVRPHLKALCSEGLVAIVAEGPAYTITDKGRADVDARKEAGVDRLLALRQAVRNSIESSLQAPLIEGDFTRLWGVFEERMAHYFMSRGESIVAEICELLGAEEGINSDAAHAPRLSFLTELATAVAATSSHSGRQSELEQAVKDLFSDRTGPASDWLVRIAANFMTACALGLEHTSARAVERLLAKTRLLLDTDVVLSLFGEGEPEHDGVVALVDRWKRLGGEVFVAEPVLEEVARHAYIANNDFNQVRHWIPGTAEERAHLVGNAFVRSYAELMFKQNARISEWRNYLRMFIGTSEYDWRCVAGTLQADYYIKKMPPPGLPYTDLQHQVQSFLAQFSHTEAARDDAYREDKARRDALLYATLVSFIDKLREQDPSASCLLVSSAKRLIAVEEQFNATGESQIVATVSAVVYMLSMMPSVTLGLSAMKSFIFDERRANFSGNFERTVLRLVHGSSERSLPFAKRGSLMRSLRERIIKGANQQGDRRTDSAIIHQYERAAFDGNLEKRTLQMISSSLDEIGVDRRIEDENSKLRRQIDELKKQLEKERQRGSTKTKPRAGRSGF